MYFSLKSHVRDQWWAFDDPSPEWTQNLRVTRVEAVTERRRRRRAGHGTLVFLEDTHYIRVRLTTTPAEEAPWLAGIPWRLECTRPHDRRRSSVLGGLQDLAPVLVAPHVYRLDVQVALDARVWDVTLTVGDTARIQLSLRPR